MLPLMKNRNEGTPSAANPASLPNTTVNTTVVKSGWIIAQRGPKIVCLYCETKFLFTNRMTRSLYFQTSFRWKSSALVLGTMTVENFCSLFSIPSVPIFYDVICFRFVPAARQARFQKMCGIPAPYLIRWHVLCHDGARGDYRAVPDRNALHDQRA